MLQKSASFTAIQGPIVTIVLLVVSGWLGGKMVYVLRVAVSEGAGESDVDDHRREMRDAARRV